MLRQQLADSHFGRQQGHTEPYETTIRATLVSHLITFRISPLILNPHILEAWLPYMQRYTSILSKHQVTNGGNLVLSQLENEFWGQRTNSGAENWPLIAYMQQLEKISRDAGLVIVSIYVLNLLCYCEVLMCKIAVFYECAKHGQYVTLE